MSPLDKYNWRWLFSGLFALLVGVIFLPQWFIDGGWMPRMIGLGLTALVLAFFAKTRIGSSTTAIALLFLLLFSIPALVISVNQGDALLFYAGLVSLVVVSLAGSRLFSTKSQMRVSFGLSILLLVLSIWGWVEWWNVLEGFRITHEASYEVKASLGHRNLFVQYLVLLLPFAIWHMVKKASAWQLALGAVITSVPLILLLLNRSAWIGLLIIFIALWWHDRRTNEMSRLFRFNFKLIAIYSAVIALVALLFLVDEVYTLWHHLVMTFDLEAGTTLDRILLAWHSVLIFLDHPLFGSGWGMWKILQMGYDQTGMLSESARLIYQRPHNDYLWMFAEGGLLVGLLYAGLHLLGLTKAWKSYQKDKTFRSLTLLLSWVLFILCSITVFPLERPEYLLFLALLFAWQIQREIRASEKPRSSSVWSRIFLLTASVACLVVFVQRANAEHQFYLAVEARSESRWSDALRYADSSENAGMLVDHVSAPMQYHKGLFWYQSGKTEEAQVSFLNALQLNPNHPEVWNNLGMLYNEKGEHQKALHAFQQAVKNTPSFPDAWLNLSVYEYNKGQWRQAFDYFMKADTTAAKQLYFELGARLATDSLKQMVKKSEDRKMELTLLAFSNTPEWALVTIMKSAANGLPFHRQAHLDACYYMWKNCEFYEDCPLAEEMINKYLPNGFEDLNLEE